MAGKFTFPYFLESSQIKLILFSGTKKHCGWSMRNPRCPVEYSDTKVMTWMRWEQQVRGHDKETGEARMCLEFVPHVGTRLEFTEEFQAQYEMWMPHVHRDRVRKFMCHKQVEYVSSLEQIANPTVAISKADFATTVEVQRIFSATCAFPERFNVFCLVSVHCPKAVTNYRKKKAWGRRRARSRRKGEFVTFPRST